VGLNLYYFYLLRRPAEDIPSHAYLHKGPEPVGEVEDPDLVGEDGEIRIEDVVIGYNDDDDQHQERPPVPLSQLWPWASAMMTFERASADSVCTIPHTSS